MQINSNIDENRSITTTFAELPDPRWDTRHSTTVSEVQGAQGQRAKGTRRADLGEHSDLAKECRKDQRPNNDRADASTTLL